MSDEKKTAELQAMSKRRIATGLAVLVVLLVGILRVRPRADEEAWIVAAPVVSTEIAAPGTYWAREGFVEMTAPIRPPTTTDGSAHIVVYIKIPKDKRITIRRSSGRPLLAFPTGTTADRVEYVGKGGIDDPPDPSWLAADVRGLRIQEVGEEFHALRPTGSSPSARLRGIAWPRDDARAQEEATRALGDLVVKGLVLSPSTAPERAKNAAHLRSINDCADCHRHGRPPRLHVDEPGVVNRGTDASGFFHVATVLDDRAPLETYRPRDANRSDPFVRYECDGRPAEVHASDDVGAVRCKDGKIPVGILDVGGALRARDPHALRVCGSRRHLYEHLDDEAKGLFRTALDVCNVQSTY